MSMVMFAALMILSSAPAADQAIGPDDWSNVVTSAHENDVPPQLLYRALTAPVSKFRRPNETRLCLARNAVVRGKTGAVCRTRQQWAALGIEITDTKG